MTYPGTVYLLHLDPPFGHAAHYLGWSQDPTYRLQHHAGGSGANLLRHARAAGCGWHLARVWPQADRYRERQLKANGHTARCPLCSTSPSGWQLPGGTTLWRAPEPWPDRYGRQCTCGQDGTHLRSWGRNASRGLRALCLEHAAELTARRYGATPAMLRVGHVLPYLVPD